MALLKIGNRWVPDNAMFEDMSTGMYADNPALVVDSGNTTFKFYGTERTALLRWLYATAEDVTTEAVKAEKKPKFMNGTRVKVDAPHVTGTGVVMYTSHRGTPEEETTIRMANGDVATAYASDIEPVTEAPAPEGVTVTLTAAQVRAIKHIATLVTNWHETHGEELYFARYVLDMAADLDSAISTVASILPVKVA